MKQAFTKSMLTGIITMVLVAQVFAQNFSVLNSNNERNGLSNLKGPEQVTTPLWTVNNAQTTNIGWNIYSYGDLFVTSRSNGTQAVIECRNLHTGQLVWTSPFLANNSLLYTTAFNEDAVYAHDYQSEKYYALNPSDGSIKWVIEDGSFTFGPIDSPIFTQEGNLIINTPYSMFNQDVSLLMCVDKDNGSILWTNINYVPYLPNRVKAAHGNRLYMISGAAVGMPKQLVAIDMTTGESIHYSEPLDGDSGQNHRPFIAPDGTIYFFRDSGPLYSVTDNGNSFAVNWTYTPVSVSTFGLPAIDLHGNILICDDGRIRRIRKNAGQVTHSSVLDNLDYGTFLIGADSVIYFNTQNGNYYAFSYDLQTVLWSKNVPGNAYAGPMIAKDGIMIMAGSGNTIQAYKRTAPAAPLAEFTSSSRKINAGGLVNFTDLSSYNPTSWLWEFPGGTPSTSTGQNPQNIVYPEPGVYDVKLIVTNEFGADTLVKSNFIDVKEQIIFLANIQHVISAAGDYLAGDNISFSITIGEPVVETFSTTNVTLTQGFQQPFDIFIQQIITVAGGWSGISGYVAPLNKSLESLFAPWENDLIIMASLNGFYWPSGGTNTLGEWDNSSGYQVKALNGFELKLRGTAMADRNIDINNGWNLLPVPVACETPVEEVFADFPSLTIVKEVAGTNLYWPAFNINTLENLQPGQSYFMKASDNGVVTFTECQKSLSTAKPVSYPENFTPWQNVHQSASSHIIAFPAEAFSGSGIRNGDAIGVFTLDGKCAGWMVVSSTDAPLALTAFGLDEWSSASNGFMDGEAFQFRVFSPSSGDEMLLDVAFNPALPDMGNFSPHGLSAVESLKLQPLDVSEGFNRGLNIYPNPSNGYFSLGMHTWPDKTYIQLIDTKGTITGAFVLGQNENGYSHAFDFTHLPNGIYYLQVTGSEWATVRKVVISR